MANPSSTTISTDDGIPASLRRSREPKTTPVVKQTAPVVARKGKVLEDLTATPAAVKKEPVTPKATQKAKGKPEPVVQTKKHVPSKIERTDGNPQKSIVPMRFKARYSEHDDSNGDKVAVALKDATTGRNADGRPCLDLSELALIAKANGIDMAQYEHLNNGQKRMNVGNKLRGLLKAGKDVRIGTEVFSAKNTTKILARPEPKVAE